MHFRYRGNNIQVVRSQPDPATGKAKSVPVGSINGLTLAISDKLRESCSRDELREIEAWVRRYQSLRAFKLHYAALTLPEQMAAAARWFETATPEEARSAADEIWASIAQLRRTLNRRGLL